MYNFSYFYYTLWIASTALDLMYLMPDPFCTRLKKKKKNILYRTATYDTYFGVCATVTLTMAAHSRQIRRGDGPMVQRWTELGREEGIYLSRGGWAQMWEEQTEVRR